MLIYKLRGEAVWRAGCGVLGPGVEEGARMTPEEALEFLHDQDLTDYEIVGEPDEIEKFQKLQRAKADHEQKVKEEAEAAQKQQEEEARKLEAAKEEVEVEKEKVRPAKRKKS